MRVVIVGAGVMGLASAWRLARRGVEVVVLDPRPPGGGASGAALGALWPASPLIDGELQRLHRESLWEFEAFVRAIIAASAVPIPWRRGGRVELLDSEKAASRAREEAAVANQHWPAFGGALPTMEVVTAAQVEQLFPEVAAHGRAALVCRATAQVRVDALMAALAAACRQAGVTFVREQVNRMAVQNTRVHAVQTDSQRLEAHVVLLATGAWTSLLQIQGNRAANIEPVKGQGIALARPAGLTLSTVIKSGPVYLVPWDQEILVGSTTENAGFDEAATVDASEMLRTVAGQLVPALLDAPVLRHWAGLRPRNPDKGHRPIMAWHAAYENLFLCVGHFKTGIGMAPRVSQLAAEAVMTRNIS